MRSAEPSVMRIKYRSDIDGLRGLAVMAVILFHAGFSTFRGGFVGVDVFFVISGYLITALSVSDFETGNFSILKFFEKRARRILPAVLLVIFACVPLSLTILNPLQTKQFFESATFSLLFSSNVYFWQQAGYFDTSAELKPLLHTWSLAVEEQYYLLFPFILILFARLRWKIAVAALIAIFVLSIFLAQYWINNAQKMTAFYLLPSRAWEIVAGSLCALVLRTNALKIVSDAVAEVVSVLGIILIVTAFLVFNDNTRTPGVHTLIPVLGVCFVILFSRAGSRTHAALSIRPLVFGGLISFSAYLWHQPAFAFARAYSDAPLSSSTLILLCTVVLSLSVLSWKFVEVPFRSQKRLPISAFLSISAALGGGLFVVSATGAANYGYISLRYSQKVVEMYQDVLRSVDFDWTQGMYNDGKCVFSVGNIHGVCFSVRRSGYRYR